MDLKIATPCPMTWEQLQGGGERLRYCGRCQLNVYNFAEMRPAEIEAIVLKTEGRLCARIYERADGTATTQDCPVGRARKTFRRFAQAAVWLIVGAASWLLSSQVKVQPGSLPPIVRKVIQLLSPRSSPVVGEMPKRMTGPNCGP